MKFKMMYVPIIIMLIVGAAMVGLTDYLTASLFDKDINWTNFITNIITSQVGILCLILSVLLWKIDEFINNDEDYKRMYKTLLDFYINKFVAPVFRVFAHEINLEYKRDAYLEKVQKKYRRLKPKPKDLAIYFGTNEEAKKNNKYCRKEKYLAMLMTDEYIDNILPKIHIKHNTISESLIFSGIPTSSKRKDYITKHKALTIIKDLIPKFLIGMTFTFLMAAIAFEFKRGISWDMIIKTCSKIFTIVSQLYFAIDYSKKYNQSVTLHDLQFRYSKKVEFEIWTENKSREIEQELSKKGVELNATDPGRNQKFD